MRKKYIFYCCFINCIQLNQYKDDTLENEDV